MSLNESTVEAAALEWFRLRQGFGGQVGSLGYTCLSADALTRPLPRGEESREAIARLIPAMQFPLLP